MSSDLDQGECEHCGSHFGYALIHNGFNDSAFAYCDSCGRTAILSAWFEGIPEEADFKPHGPVSLESEARLSPCECGGTFRSAAAPRCPSCNSELSARTARSWIEANAPGTAKGWRWQGSWSGLYAIVVEGRFVKDNWREHAV
jgi:hypothetical protein